MILELAKAFLRGQGACEEALAFVDELTEEEIVTGDWTPAHYVWLTCNRPSWITWLRAKHMLNPPNLSGYDLRDLYLAEADFRGADLSNADLRGSDLTAADVSGANLSGAFSDVEFPGWALDAEGRLYQIALEE